MTKTITKIGNSQGIVFDAARGNLLIDIPEFGARPLRLIEGTGRASLD